MCDDSQDLHASRCVCFLSDYVDARKCECQGKWRALPCLHICEVGVLMVVISDEAPPVYINIPVVMTNHFRLLLG